MERIEPSVTVEQLLEESVYSADVETTQQTGKARQSAKEQRCGALLLVGVAHFSGSLLTDTFQPT